MGGIHKEARFGYLLSSFCFVFLSNRPSKLYGADASVSSPKGSLGSSEATRAPFERAPHSVDLDITLEDKDKVF